MPTTFVGLLLFAFLLVPGFVHFVTRRALVPAQSKFSPFIETAELVTVSLAMHVLTLTLLALYLSSPVGQHSPDLAELLQSPRDYVLNGENRRLGYLGSWCLGLLAVSTSLAIALAYRRGPFGWLGKQFAPSIANSPAWYYAFDQLTPEGAMVHVGCQLKSGWYVGGYLDWYSTEQEESGDRDLVLATPEAIGPSSTEIDLSSVQRVVIAGRDIDRIDVSYIEDEHGGASGADPAGDEPRPDRTITAAANIRQ